MHIKAQDHGLLQSIIYKRTGAATTGITHAVKIHIDFSPRSK